MKLQVVKEFGFDAAHYLPGYPGKCQNLHGHHWKLLIGVTGPIDTLTDMVVDFKELKKSIDFSIIDELDHHCLNAIQIFSFPSGMPTAENMVKWIVNRLSFPPALKLSLVRLYETETSYAEWTA